MAKYSQELFEEIWRFREEEIIPSCSGRYRKAYFRFRLSDFKRAKSTIPETLVELLIQGTKYPQTDPSRSSML